MKIDSFDSQSYYQKMMIIMIIIIVKIISCLAETMKIYSKKYNIGWCTRVTKQNLADKQ